MDYNKLDKTKVYTAFSQGNTLISKAIRWLTSSRFSHCFILYWDKDYQSWMALGDNYNGWVFTPATSENTLAVASSPVDMWASLRANSNYLGSFYDYLCFVGMLFVILGERVWKSKSQWRNPLDQKSKFICSEIATKVNQDAGLALNLLPSSTHPQRLYATMKMHPEVEFIEEE